MWFARYSPRLATGAAGFVVGLFCQNLPFKQHFLVSSANPVEIDIDDVISREIETYATTLSPVMKFGYPSYETLRTNGDFMVSFDRRNRNPGWVMEHLTSDMLVDSGISRKGKRCYEDKSIHEFFRATPADYTNSGYDKGHLARAANYKYNKDVYNDTYALTNITPQVPDCNQVIWLELEKRVLKLVKKYGSIYVCCGPLYMPRSVRDGNETIEQLLNGDEPSTEREVRDGEKKISEVLNESEPPRKKRRKMKKENSKMEKENSITEKEESKTVKEYSKPKKFILYEVIGKNNVAVPTHHFKVILSEVKNNVYDMEAYIIPNQNLKETKPNEKKSLRDYMVNKDTIERLAGFLLFHKLPPNALRYVNGKENGSLY